MLKLRILNSLRFLRNKAVYFCGRNRLLSRLFFLITGDFDREFEFTLKGRYDALSHRYTESNSNANIRRCVHRLEKGLFHAKPKKKFGKEVFNELVRELKKYDIKNMDYQELHWLYKTLSSYEDSSFEPQKVSTLIDLAQKEMNSRVVANELQEVNSSSFQNFKHVLLKRKSVRFYKEQKVDLNAIRQCVEIAKQVPSACNRQPYHIELLTQKKDILKVGRMAPGTAGWIEGVQVLGVVVGHSNSFRFTRDRHLIYFDSGLFISNFINSLTSLGLSSCICNWIPNWKEDRAAIKYLGYDLSKTIVCLIAIGHSSGIESPISTKKSTENLLRIRHED